MTPKPLSTAAISTVNLAEVHGKLVGRGLSPDDVWEAALSPIREDVPFTSEHARVAGDLVAQTRPLGLFLGDRACLALGLALQVPVYTADKSWKKVKAGACVHVIGLTGHSVQPRYLPSAPPPRPPAASSSNP